MGKLRITMTILSLIALMTTLTSCGNKEAYGKITLINDKEITIETGSWEAASPAGEDFTPDGGSAAYVLASYIDISDLNKDTVVKLSLDNNAVTAIETLGDSNAQAAGSASGAKIPLSAPFTLDEKKQTSSNHSYTAADSDVSAVLVKNSGALTLNGGSLIKTGDTTDDNQSRSRGLNAVLAVTGGSSARINGTTLTSGSTGSNAIFATGQGTKINAVNFKIYTTGDSSGGLVAAEGSSLAAMNGDITTRGTHSAPLSTDGSSGTMKVRNTTFRAEGDASPCIYSAGTIAADHVTGSSMESRIAVIRGNNAIALNDCILQGAGKSGILLYQDTARSVRGEASFKSKDSTLTTTSAGPMFHVTNTSASATLENTSLYYSSNILANVAGNSANSWGKPGENGGNFTLTGINQSLEGSILCDSISAAVLNLTKKSTFTGSFDPENTARTGAVALDNSSFWIVTGNSYVTSIRNKDKACRNIKSNGYTVFYDKDNPANSWLKGAAKSLPGGGQLKPAS